MQDRTEPNSPEPCFQRRPLDTVWWGCRGKFARRNCNRSKVEQCISNPFNHEGSRQSEKLHLP